MAYGRSNDDIIDDVAWQRKVKVVIPISLRPVISKTTRDRDSVLTGHHLPPQPNIKAGKKITWRIYALSERLLVKFIVTIAMDLYCYIVDSEIIGQWKWHYVVILLVNY